MEQGAGFLRPGRIGRPAVAVAGLLVMLALPADAQQPDSGAAEVRAVLRAFYLNLDSRNWEALAAYVLSPKLLERRGDPRAPELAARDRLRTLASSHSAADPGSCLSSSPPMVDKALIRIDQDWAEASVPRCSGSSPAADEFRLLYFEGRWRFIYTDLFEAPANF